MLITDQLLSSTTAKAGLSTTAVAAVARVNDGTIQVSNFWYSVLSVGLALAGVYLARQVTIGEENRTLGREQSYRETGPLTWIGILIICPFIWHYNIAVPWASLLGLGVGYSVRVLLRIFGDGTVAAVREFLRRAGAGPAAPAAPAPPPAAPPTLDAPGAKHVATILPPTTTPEQHRLLGRIDDVTPDEDKP